MNLTVCYITSRRKPMIEWFFASLGKQVGSEDIQVLVVDSFNNERHDDIVELFNSELGEEYHSANIKSVTPKPTIWQGEHKITKHEWWAKSNALNTAICLCQTEWIAFVDDRCVLGDGWMAAVRTAMAGNYAVCGSYEKRANMKVENGVIVDHGELLGEDTRRPGLYPFDSWYGGSGVLPLEWCLAVNGFSEDMCDGLGSEDSMFGKTLLNSGYPVKYDSRMRIIEDRTPSEIEGALKRADKNSHLGQKAKSWDIVRCFRDKTTSQNSFDIRDMRNRKLKGEDWRPPTASHYDWYDGQFIGDME